jgi:hypothetical protein
MTMAQIAFAASIVLGLSFRNARAAEPVPAAISTVAARDASVRAAGAPAPSNSQHCDQDASGNDADAADAAGVDDGDGADASAANPGDDRDGDGSAALPNSGADSGCSKANDQPDPDDDAQDDTAPPPGPTVTSGVDYYSDSEHNQVWSDRTVQTLPFDNYVLVYRKDAVQALDGQGYQRLAATSFSIHRDLTEQFGLSGGFGVVRSLAWSDPVGSLESEINLLGASLTARISRDMLSTTAQEIRANIRQTDLSLSFSEDLNKQLSVDVELHHTLYSDGNDSNDFEFSPQYTIELEKSKLSLGYQFQYSAFGVNPDNGYWAPKELLAHAAILKWAYDWSIFFGSVQMAAGYQSVGQFALAANQVGNSYGGGSGLDESMTGKLGVRLTKSCSMEYYLNRDSSVGFSSTATGIVINYAF